MAAGPLAGLRVLDASDEISRFAVKLLAEAGASVVRVGTGHDTGPAMADPVASARGGLLDWWYDGGIRRAPLDLDTDAGRDSYRALAARADLIIDGMPPGRLAGVGLDHAALLPANERLVQVSLTPFGQSGPWSRWATSDIVAGVLAACCPSRARPTSP